MKNYSVEHIGIAVEDPIAMGEWYRDVMGFKIRYSGKDNEKAVVFIADCNGSMILELGKLPRIDSLAKKLDHHLQFHIALKSGDPEADKEYLIGKGATFIEKSPITREGDFLLTFYDPWGNCIQLAKRKDKI
jgi:glyoxylase I family protein